MTDMIERVFLSVYSPNGASRDDSAVLDMNAGMVAFTTDSFVVAPIFFPGGDIGRLAVAGTVNDLLTSAASPVALSASFIIEEGLEVGNLERIAISMRDTAREAGVDIVTGDTKVVPRGLADKVFITTSGVGTILRPGVSGACARPGDRVILSGSVGDHGTAVMLARERLLESESILSDCAPLTDIVLNLIKSGCDIHAMRDPTRGGLASSLNEIARQSGVMIEIEECAVPVRPAIAAACEALGLDVFQVANEGKMLVFVSPEDATRALEVVRWSRYGDEARIIGEVHPTPSGRVQVRTSLGTSRILSVPSGELLPRIC
ncbi:MAG: hydrogenase expression/formation protein HypE [Armatimonadetes bacterium]|nr:hydrogenase expression/formation protein HypE [Armatimonadota bacterium]